MTNIIATEHGVSRRMALKVLAVMSASGHAQAEPGILSLQRPDAKATDSMTDPNLRSPTAPWPRTLSEQALQTLSVLCDLILPADDTSPSASTLGCHEFIDEWVSAPYPDQMRDNELILDGLVWLDKEAQRRFKQCAFTALEVPQQHEICGDICAEEADTTHLQLGTDFFAKVRNLTAAAYWTTQEGMDDLGYIGNVPLSKWTLPPKEVLAHLKLTTSDIP